MRRMFDQDPEGLAPEGAPVAKIIPASFGRIPDPAEAIFEASPQVELFDEEAWAVPKLWFDPQITDDPTSGRAGGATALAALSERAAAAVEQGAFPLILGSDDRAMTGLCAAASGTPLIHLSGSPSLKNASAGEAGGAVAQALSRGRSVTSAGLRTLTTAEAQTLDRAPQNLTAFLARSGVTPARIVEALPEGPVLIGIDLSVFDARVMPAVDAPDPGGLIWEDVMAILKALSQQHSVAGAAIYGLKPQPRLHAADFLAAKLAYKLLGAAFAPAM